MKQQDIKSSKVLHHRVYVRPMQMLRKMPLNSAKNATSVNAQSVLQKRKLSVKMKRVSVMKSSCVSVVAWKMQVYCPILPLLQKKFVVKKKPRKLGGNKKLNSVKLQLSVKQRHAHMQKSCKKQRVSKKRLKHMMLLQVKTLLTVLKCPLKAILHAILLTERSIMLFLLMSRVSLHQVVQRNVALSVR